MKTPLLSACPEGCHTHGLAVVENTTRNFWLLLFPLLRGLGALQFDLYSWVRGAWFDLLIVVVLLASAVLRWQYYTYMLTDEGIYFRKGVILRKAATLPWSCLSGTTFEQPPLYRLLGVQHFRAETDAGSSRRADFRITLSNAQAAQLARALAAAGVAYQSRGKKASARFRYRPSWGYLALFSILSSSSLSGVLFASAFITMTGAIIGRKLEQDVLSSITELSRHLAFGIPPLAAMLSIVLFLGWLFSFLRNVLRYLRFELSREDDGHLLIRTGYFGRYAHRLSPCHINYLDLRQTLLTKLLSVSSGYIHSSGYGKGKNEIAVLIPATAKKTILRTIRRLLPELLPSNAANNTMEASSTEASTMEASSMEASVVEAKPPKLTFWGFISNSVFVVLLIPCAALLLRNVFPDWSQLIVFAAFMAEIPSIWWLIVNFVSFYTTSIRFDGRILTLLYASAYAFHTVTIPVGKVVQVRITQSIFQRMGNCCSLQIYTCSERSRRHTVPNLLLADARAFEEAYCSR